MLFSLLVKRTCIHLLALPFKIRGCNTIVKIPYHVSQTKYGRNNGANQLAKQLVNRRDTLASSFFRVGLIGFDLEGGTAILAICSDRGGYLQMPIAGRSLGYAMSHGLQRGSDDPRTGISK